MAEYKELLESLGKRPRTVLELILREGSVSTYKLGQLGYDQPPRAAQDLKEAGVRLKVTYGKHPKTGSRMAIYSLADENEDPRATARGRRAFPKALRKAVLDAFQNRCSVCSEEYDPTVLQLDHRIPYIVGGDPKEFHVKDFQPLCASHQRSKSWVCEHCPNREDKVTKVCMSCYWAIPDGDYTHIATVAERRVDVTWKGDQDRKTYRRLRSLAAKEGKSVPEVIKNLIKTALQKKP